jgi:alkanesulfonate monooxygenase SsuD/methylene tetrahydromethanopterin reductase-like flavin-dependent oxidoreductase (luciferase family)
MPERDLLFGTFLTPSAAQPEHTVELAELTERVGLDLVSVQDHPYQPAFLDAWTLLSVIAARTRRVHVLPNVANLPLRPPAVLARSAASLDILTGGRVEMGLGAGAFWDAIAASGGPRREPGDAVDALGEAIAVLRALWSPGSGVRLDGKHYSLHGAKPGPFPVHEIGVWVGAIKPRMLRLTGRLADGWLPSSQYVPPDQLAGANRIIDDAALAAGRSPDDVRRLYNISGSFAGSGREFFQGPPHVWVEQLAELTLAENMTGFLLIGDVATDIERFGFEVAPAVRELVAQERASTTPPPDAGVPARAEPVAAAPGRARRSGTDPLHARPTPDTAARLSTERLWDENDRPAGPPAPTGRSYTPHEQASGQHLIDVHDQLRQELQELRGIADRVAEGSLDVGRARSALQTMTLRQNDWTLGAYCASFCRIVTMHHTLEDQSLFPHLRAADPQLSPVVDRLEVEHKQIHGVVDRVDQALVALVSEPDGLDELRAAIDLLHDALLSHLSYEERELVEPLARLGYR